MTENAKLDQALAVITSQIVEEPRIGIVLGSGLGDFADSVTDARRIATSTIPHYPRSTVQGHEGTLVFGRIRERARESPPVIVFKGRVHYYETVDLDAVHFPVRLAASLGVRVLLFTNAAGGIGRGLAPGDLMLISDIVNLAFLDPLRGHEANVAKPLAGSRSSRMVDETLLGTFRDAAGKIGVPLREGTYCWLKGPSYETKAEVEMLRRIGVDAVGMSTVPEIMEANSLGIRAAGISLISNLAAGISGLKLSHEEVTQAGQSVRLDLARLLTEVLLYLPAS